MKMRIFLSVVALAAAITACSNQEPVSEAQKMTVEDFRSSPTFYWFPTAVDSYKPNTDMVKQIKDGFNTSTDKLAVFVKPSCSCKGTQYLFPQVVKTVQDAGLNMANVEIWSMKGINDKQPYASMITITDLPAIYLIRDGKVKSQLLEVEYNEMNADTLLAKAINN